MRRSRAVTLLLAAGVGALTLVGLFGHGIIAGVALVMVAALLVTLSTSTWEAQPTGGRIARTFVVALVLAAAAARFAQAF